MLRSVGAVLAGLVIASLVVMACTWVAVATMLPPAGPGMIAPPTSAYLVVNLGYSLLAAFLGGEVAARLAARNPMGHAIGLGVLLLVLGVTTAALTSSGSKGNQPWWYLYVVALLGWVGASVAGLRHAREEGAATATP